MNDFSIESMAVFTDSLPGNSLTGSMVRNVETNHGIKVPQGFQLILEVSSKALRAS